jgi:hypothetical protein
MKRVFLVCLHFSVFVLPSGGINGCVLVCASVFERIREIKELERREKEMERES